MKMFILKLSGLDNNTNKPDEQIANNLLLCLIILVRQMPTDGQTSTKSLRK